MYLSFMKQPACSITAAFLLNQPCALSGQDNDYSFVKKKCTKQNKKAYNYTYIHTYIHNFPGVHSQQQAW